MKHADIASMMRDIAPVIREFTAASLVPLSDRIDVICRRLDDLPAHMPGKDADEQAIEFRVRESIGKDISALRDDVSAIRDAIVEPDIQAIAEKAATLVPKPKDGDPGKSVSVDDLKPVISECVKSAVAEIPAAKDGVGLASTLIDRDGDLVVTLTDGRQQKLGPVVGKSVDERVVVQSLCAEVSDRIENLKGEVDKAVERVSLLKLPDIDALIADAVKALPAAIQRSEVQDMIDKSLPTLPPPIDVEAEVGRQIDKALATIPRPKDGTSVTVDDVRPLIESEVKSAVDKMPKPKDGADGRGLASMLIDRDGGLVATMTDGRTEKLGSVVGRDGKDVDMPAIERAIADAVKALPKPKDGVDGLGFDDMDIETGDDGVFLRFEKGDVVKRCPVPVVVDCGVFKQGRTYNKANGVTWGGSFWIAQKETSDKPGESDVWRLAVKKGRDGKDAKS